MRAIYVAFCAVVAFGALVGCSYPDAQKQDTNGAFAPVVKEARDACEARGGKPVVILGTGWTVICFAPEVLR